MPEAMVPLRCRLSLIFTVPVVVAACLALPQ